MNILDIINKKRNKLELTKEEIEFFINGILDETIKDYQISSLLMAITINGMNVEETINLTEAMKNSGDIIDLSSLSRVIVDKHSTGGVGDKTTLIVGPIVAANDVSIAKMSGRGLGFTGGTIDKLEAIDNFDVNIKMEDFKKQIKDINIAIVSQMANLVKADKILYALRDVTGTVQSLPLIAASIMSKKLASNADIIVIDVKVGDGALMKNVEDAKTLASLMVEIGKRNNKKIVCVLSNMDQPLGYAIGNSLEVKEAINILKGSKEPNDLYELSVTLSSIILSLALNITMEEANKKVMISLENGSAYNKFEELVKYQKGNIDNIDSEAKIFSIKAIESGYIEKIDTEKIGEIVRKIGAGRYTKEDKIDYSVGMILNKKIGDFILKDEELLKIYLKEKDVKISEILNCFHFSVHAIEPINKDKLIIDIISDVK